MTRPKITIVNSSSFGVHFPEHLRRLKTLGHVRHLKVSPRISGERLAGKLQGCQAVVASVQPAYDAAFFRQNRDVILVARHGIGINNVDVEAATRHGVLVTKVPGVVERQAMAEHTIALMLAVARRVLPAHTAVARGRWSDRAHFVGLELRKRVVGLIGFGNIGSQVGKILSRGFGASVLAFDPGVARRRIKRGGARPVPLRNLLAQADVISLHASLNSSSRHILNGAALRRMKRGVLIVNTGRGELIDERALLRQLRSGKVAGLGVDVVTDEPAGRGHGFLRHPNVIVVPHIGAYTGECLKAMGDKIVNDLKDVLRRRRRPAELVNPEVWRSPRLRFRRWR